MKLKAKVWVSVALFLGVLAFFAYKTAREKRLAIYSNASPAERGWMIMEDKGCQTCHQPDSGYRAPILKGLYGRAVKLADGSELTADDAYIKQSIMAPMTRVVAGYQAVMPNYMGQLSEDELNYVIEAMKSQP